MRVAALYDVHGNLPALEGVLDDVRAAGVELRRTDDEVHAAAERMRGAGLPELDRYLESSLLAPIPREEAMAEFERLASRGP